MRNGGRAWRREGSPVVLDGRRLARERSAGLAARAARVARERGLPPRLALVAFAQADGHVPYVARKIRACREAGVEVVPLILPAGTTTDGACRAVAGLLRGDAPDGIFLEFPFPASVDGDSVMELVPEAADLDVMTEGRIRRYLSDGEGPPPLTVSAGLELLDGYGIDVAGLEGIVVGEAAPFTLMLREALARRGARVQPILAADSPDLYRRVEAAGLVIAAAGRPGLLRAEKLAAGAVAIDVGYFNPGGRGDIDTSSGMTHLAAIAPVPGGIGPMTVSVLVERVIEFAERSAGSSREPGRG